MDEEEAMDVGKIVGYFDALVEENLREGLMNSQDEHKLRHQRSIMMSNFRALRSRKPGVQEEARQYFAELHRIINLPPPGEDFIERYIQ